MAHHLQGTLRGVQMPLWDPKTTFLLVHGEPECSCFWLIFGIFTSRCCQAYHHDRLAERSSICP
eukprot:2430160-Prymnesium_polylepis.1